jgi:hypothetical protein
MEDMNGDEGAASNAEAAHEEPKPLGGNGTRAHWPNPPPFATRVGKAEARPIAPVTAV